MAEQFHSIRIDVDNGIYEVNGRNVSETGKYLNLTFEKGMWSLMISEDHLFNTAPATKRKKRRKR